MSHQALYRKWRPKVFGDILGQDAIVTTLKNQINTNSIAHAYLFSGTRGTGKTSTARVFSRALNCESPKENNPCNSCPICKGMLEESLMDAVEIDAASNNGVDDIRELRETIKYPPAQAKYKIYIIDEVHMLSQGAFNALLKTLEEPPHYAVFILATTEPQKIPATILSRCQRYDFKRVGNEILIRHLREICTSVNVKAQDSALEAIVANSDGAVRDAQSILDQCLGSAGNQLSYEHVVSVLGITDESFLFRLIESILENQSAQVMALIDGFISGGGHIGQLIRGLLEHYRKLMLAKTQTHVTELIQGTDAHRKEIFSQSQKLSLSNTLRAIDLLGNLSSQLRWINQPRIHLEMTLIKIMHPQGDSSMEGILDRIERLEKIVSTGQLCTTGNHGMENEKPEQRPLHTESNQVTREEESIAKPNQREKDNLHIENHESGDVSLKTIQTEWELILEDVKKEKIQAHALLVEAKATCLENSVLTVSFPNSDYDFHMEMLSRKENKQIIQEVLSRRFSCALGIECCCEDQGLSSTGVDKELSKDEAIRAYLGTYEEHLKIVD